VRGDLRARRASMGALDATGSCDPAAVYMGPISLTLAALFSV